MTQEKRVWVWLSYLQPLQMRGQMLLMPIQGFTCCVDGARWNVVRDSHSAIRFARVNSSQERKICTAWEESAPSICSESFNYMHTCMPLIPKSELRSKTAGLCNGQTTFCRFLSKRNVLIWSAMSWPWHRICCRCCVFLFLFASHLVPVFRTSGSLCHFLQ